MSTNVAILGATDDPMKYANMAQRDLQAAGHTVFPVNPNKVTVDGVQAYPRLENISEKIDTVTVYVRPSILQTLTDDILAVSPRRVIMNPGTENKTVAEVLEQQGIEVIRGCTIVMLHTGQF
jgi:predicted CoA-binding protein